MSRKQAEVDRKNLKIMLNAPPPSFLSNLVSYLVYDQLTYRFVCPKHVRKILQYSSNYPLFTAEVVDQFSLLSFPLIEF